MTSLDALPQSDRRRIGGAIRWKGLTAARVPLLAVTFAVLLSTGLYLEFLARHNWNAGEVVLLLHVVFGLAFTIVFLSWIRLHVVRGLPKSGRRIFTGLSWLLLVTYAVVVLTGLMMVLPAAAFLAGRIWFWSFATTHVLTLLHLWGGLAAAGGLLAHLSMRHWRQPASGKDRAAS